MKLWGGLGVWAAAYVLFGCGDAGGEQGGAGSNQGDLPAGASEIFFDAVSVDLQGAVHKGPFVVGSSLQISPLNVELDPTGQVFNTETRNDLGEFDITFMVGGPVRLEATGFYYNEISGALSQGNLTLRALYVPAGGGTQSAYVNLITHLVIDRVQALFVGGAPFEAAVEQAEQELREGLGVTVPDFDPDAHGIEMNLAGGDTDANAYLFGVSAVLAKVGVDRDPGAADAELQNLINALSRDLADGELSEPVRDEIGAALLGLDAETVMQTFSARLLDTGSTETAPDLHRVLDQDRDGRANAGDNCALLANPAQEDLDGDGIGDACDECPDTACADGCVPGTGGAGDTCVDRCGGGDACSGGEQCVSVQWPGGGSVSLCAGPCDPLADACADGARCERAALTPDGLLGRDGPVAMASRPPDGFASAQGDDWYCVPAPESLAPGSEGDACATWAGACAEGLVCAETYRGLVCTALCDPQAGNVCGGGPCLALHAGQGPGGEGPRPPEFRPDDPAFQMCMQAGLPPEMCFGMTAPDPAYQTCAGCTVGHCLPPPGQLGELCVSQPDTCDAGLACAQSSACPGGGLCCQQSCDPGAQDPGCGDGEVCADLATYSSASGACIAPAQLGETCSHADACDVGLGCASGEGCASGGQCCRTECDPQDPTACSGSEACTDRNSYEQGVFLCVAAPQSCGNGVQDGEESDIDCGGESLCRRCAASERCRVTGGDMTSCLPGLACLFDNAGGPERGVCAEACDPEAADPGCDAGLACVAGLHGEEPAAPSSDGGGCLPTASAGDACVGYGQCESGYQCFASEDCAGDSGMCCVAECDALDGDPGCSVGRVCVGNLPHAPAEAGACIVEPASCQNATRDGAESDVDCGGQYCKRCAGGDRCSQGSDCAGGIECVWANSSGWNVCAAACDLDAPACDAGFACGGGTGPGGGAAAHCLEIPASCSNDSQDAGESDVDCGGTSLCGPCGEGDLCTENVWQALPLQCADGLVCYGAVCVTTFCEDSTQNYNESDVDCGGSCGRCADGRLCAGSDYNCESNSCLSPRTYPGESTGPYACAPSHCTSGVLDGDETTADCGGSCRPCVLNATCNVDFDCESYWCNGGRCRQPSCADSVQNGTETGVNCGGNCPNRCAAGQGCRNSNDCQWNPFPPLTCDDGTCTTCLNGLQDGDETGQDCGGALCPACP